MWHQNHHTLLRILRGLAGRLTLSSLLSWNTVLELADFKTVITGQKFSTTGTYSERNLLWRIFDFFSVFPSRQGNFHFIKTATTTWCHARWCNDLFKYIDDNSSWCASISMNMSSFSISDITGRYFMDGGTSNILNNWRCRTTYKNKINPLFHIAWFIDNTLMNENYLTKILDIKSSRILVDKDNDDEFQKKWHEVMWNSRPLTSFLPSP